MISMCMDLDLTPLFIKFSLDSLKEKLKFYSKSTISKESVEIQLEHLISDREYKQLIRTLYG